jgi:hypothetical protein
MPTISERNEIWTSGVCLALHNIYCIQENQTIYTVARLPQRRCIVTAAVPRTEN